MATETTANNLNPGMQPQSKNPQKWIEAENALADIKKTFGFVPSFMNNFTDESLPGAWSATKALRFSSETALEPKLKGLISHAVAVQIPCDRILYFEERATLREGASRQQQLEAVMMAGITRHWSTVLNGLQLDKKAFRKEADKIMAYVKKMMSEMAGNPPKEEMFLFKPGTADEAYKDIEQMLGIVPQFFQFFPKEAIAGAWSEFKGLQLNPFTELTGEQKELIGLAVAAQIPCDYCIYFHKSAATLNGASEGKINEAIAVAASVRHWSAMFHGPHVDLTGFKKDADQLLLNIGEQLPH